jgi:nicotine blue oxidoreductase
VGLVLAAGLGRRLGRGPKAFVRLDDETLLERAVSRSRRVGVGTIVAVLPPGPDPVGLPAGIVVVRNPRPETGPVGSACLGVAAMPEGTTCALLYPVDHHAVTDEDVARVLGAVEGAPPGTARVMPRFEGRGGHPVALLAPALAALRAVTDPAATTLRDVLNEAGPIVHVDGVGAGVRQNLNFAADLPSEGRSLATESQ